MTLKSATSSQSKGGFSMTICLSHGGQSVYAGSSPAKDLLVATIDGVVLLHREGQDCPWVVTRKRLEGRHIIALAIEPDTGTVFATMHNGGIAASEDFGETWQFRNQGIESENVYCITCSRAGDKVRLYVGTEPAHLYVSEDLGRSWRELSSLRTVPSVAKWTFPAPPHEAHVKNVAVDPTNPDKVYACIEQGGLFKSADGGETWKELQGFNDDCHRLFIRPSNPEELILPTGYGFYRSADGGDTWEDTSDRISRIGYPDPLVFNPLQENLMFLAGAEADPFHWMQNKSANPRIARSRDGGETWEVLGNGMPEHLNANFEAMTLEAWNGGCTVYAGNTDGDIYISDDEGETWVKAVQGIPPLSKTIHYTILGHDLSFEKRERTQI
jgi:photosystem II stability/assembly factor-like uncharacterized protein